MDEKNRKLIGRMIKYYSKLEKTTLYGIILPALSTLDAVCDIYWITGPPAGIRIDGYSQEWVAGYVI